MKILVLGGAGYIGSHTVAELIKEKQEVVVIDNLETGYRQAVHPDATFYRGDIRDRNFLDSVLEKESNIDAVIHFAAYSLVGESMVNPLKYYDNNIYGTKVLLEALVDHHIDKIVFSSTAATYGEPERVPILETDCTKPTNAYGETKLAMEKMFYWSSKAHDLRYVSLRYFNACGAHESGLIGEAHSPESHLIPIILQVANHQREAISIFGDDYPTKDGTCIRDYIHVIDLAKAHILAVQYLIKGNESNIFNLGNGMGHSVKEVIEAARKVTKEPIPVVIKQRRAGDPAILVASSEKARRILGWNPVHVDMEEIIESAWNWHKSHRTGYKTTLVIMAAGIGSRYGSGIKQLEKVGPSGEIIMDYSIYDAIKAGFNKVVFVIRHELEKDFKELMKDRIDKHIEVEYVYQELDELPDGFTKPVDRTKPWGTGQALLCCKDVVKEPFAVINADDYYGQEAFIKLYNFLNTVDKTKNTYAMAGFVLGNTLSDNGAVTRGICKVNTDGFLTDVEETYGIEKNGDKAVGVDETKKPVELTLDSLVSMNMWGITPAFFHKLEAEFSKFLDALEPEELKAEFLLPTIVGEMVTKHKATVEVLKTQDKWFGVTYHEDKESVVTSIRQLVAQGKYPERLFD